jgi:hypothetical protein
MQLSAVVLARVFLFVESIDLNPRGVAFYPDLIRAIVERYSFQKFPQKFEDLDETKGVVFELGKIGKKTIQKVAIYSTGLALDTTSSTQESEAILEDALAWATEKLGLHYRREMVKRKAYVSQITFYSGVPLLFVHPILKNLSEKIAKVVSENLNLSSTFEPTAILFGLDPESQRIATSPFSIERRQGTAFSEGKYFSGAPVPTDIHLALLEEFERAVFTQDRR